MRRACCVVMKICDWNLAGVWGPGGPQKLMGKCCKFLRKQLFQGLIISFSQKYRFAQNIEKIGSLEKIGKIGALGSLLCFCICKSRFSHNEAHMSLMGA